jgi:hypothetical protein
MQRCALVMFGRCCRRLVDNQPPATSQQYFSLRTNQHQLSATSQTNRLLHLLIYYFQLTYLVHYWIPSGCRVPKGWLRVKILAHRNQLLCRELKARLWATIWHTSSIYFAESQELELQANKNTHSLHQFCREPRDWALGNHNDSR